LSSLKGKALRRSPPYLSKDYIDEKKEKDKKDEVPVEEYMKDNSGNSGDVFSKIVI
jgi:hypothetical protein